MTTPDYPRRSTAYGAVSGTPFPTPGDSATGGPSVSDAGRQVAGTAQDEARNVAASAGEQVSNVASEAAAQTRHLLHETLSEARGQTGDQMTRVGATMRDLASELQQMATSSPRQGPVTEFAWNVAARGSRMADWLEVHGPDDLVSSVRRYARRSPMGFLAAAAGAGLLVGRLARAVQAGSPAAGGTARRPVTRMGGTPSYQHAATPPAAPSMGPGAAAPNPYAPGTPATDLYGDVGPTPGSLAAGGLGDDADLPGEGW